MHTQMQLLLDAAVVGARRVFDFEWLATDPLFEHLAGGAVQSIDTLYDDLRRFGPDELEALAATRVYTAWAIASCVSRLSSSCGTCRLRLRSCEWRYVLHRLRTSPSLPTHHARRVVRTAPSTPTTRSSVNTSSSLRKPRRITLPNDGMAQLRSPSPRT